MLRGEKKTGRNIVLRRENVENSCCKEMRVRTN